jgi:hypothetical protein
MKYRADRLHPLRPRGQDSQVLVGWRWGKKPLDASRPSCDLRFPARNLFRDSRAGIGDPARIGNGPTRSSKRIQGSNASRQRVSEGCRRPQIRDPYPKHQIGRQSLKLPPRFSRRREMRPKRSIRWFQVKDWFACLLRHRVAISSRGMSSQRPSSVGGIAAKRYFRLLTPRLFRKAPSLHRHYPASSLLRASPPPSGPRTVICSCLALVLHHPGGLPRFPCRSVHARCPPPPRKVQQVLTCCLPVASLLVSGFILLGGLATFVFLTRPYRVHLRCGSRVRPYQGFDH